MSVALQLEWSIQMHYLLQKKDRQAGSQLKVKTISRIPLLKSIKIPLKRKNIKKLHMVVDAQTNTIFPKERSI